jgi:arsenate reductase
LKPRRVLFICTGNSARSQLAEALLREVGGEDYEVYSAGTSPGSGVNPFAMEVLRERGIDTSALYPKALDQFVRQPFDFVVTVCDKAKQQCPTFPGAVRIDHWSLEDPASFQGTYEEVLFAFRETRDEIERRIREYIMKDRLFSEPIGGLTL